MDTRDLILKIKNTIPNYIFSIYLTGSQLTNSPSKDSDVDVYAIIQPTLYNQIHHISEIVSVETSTENTTIQIKLLTLPKYFQIMFKSNHTTLELLEAKPIYTAPEFKEFTDYLFENQYLRHHINLKFARDGLLGESKSHIHQISSRSEITNQFLKRNAKINIYLVHGLDYLKSINKNEPLNINWKKTHLPFTSEMYTIINNLKNATDAEKKNSISLKYTMQHKKLIVKSINLRLILNN